LVDAEISRSKTGGSNNTRANVLHQWAMIETISAPGRGRSVSVSQGQRSWSKP
jgi:hypothetical protein